MAIYVKYSTDVGAPTLSGTTGTLITVLDYCLVTTAGWTKSLSGTNTATYKAPGGNGMYLGVNDNGTTNAYHARVRGFEPAAGAVVAPTTAGVTIDANTAPFPLDAQNNGGCFVQKSDAANGTARWWGFVGNDRAFYLSIYSGSNYGTFFFGDFISYKSGDAFNTALIADSTASTINAHFRSVSFQNTAVNGHFIARSHTQLGSSITVSKGYDFSRVSASANLGSSGTTYPDAVVGGLLMTPVGLGESSANVARGKLPGLYAPLHNRPLANLDTFTGSGALSGKTFYVQNASTDAQYFIETSDTWYS